MGKINPNSAAAIVIEYAASIDIKLNKKDAAIILKTFNDNCVAKIEIAKNSLTQIIRDYVEAEVCDASQGVQKTEKKFVLNSKLLSLFMSQYQLLAVGLGLKGEEKDWFEAKMVAVENIINSMPEVYGQDGLGDKAIVYLHYFKNGCDWYITEKDSVVGEPQYQAYGYANLGYGAELGYISIVELLDNNVELDFHWSPKPWSEVKKK